MPARQTPSIAGSTHLDASAPFVVRAGAARSLDPKAAVKIGGPVSSLLEVMASRPEAPREIAEGAALRRQRGASTCEARVTTGRRTRLGYPEAPREIAEGAALRRQRGAITCEARATTGRRTRLGYRVYASGSVSLSVGMGH
jgi:hypothetical protein